MDAADREAIREVLLPWLGRGFLLIAAILGTAVTFGAAWRLFDLVRG